MCSAANLELVRSLGAATVIDYTADDFTQTPQRYDVIFDAVGKRKSADVMACAARGGGVSYKWVHQASMITSWARPVSMV